MFAERILSLVFLKETFSWPLVNGFQATWENSRVDIVG